jgi:hypothetical protein
MNGGAVSRRTGCCAIVQVVPASALAGKEAIDADDCPMKTLSKTIADMNIEELQQSANASFEEAATLPPGPQKQNILLLAHMIRVLAELKKVVIISESE